MPNSQIAEAKDNDTLPPGSPSDSGGHSPSGAVPRVVTRTSDDLATRPAQITVALYALGVWIVGAIVIGLLAGNMGAAVGSLAPGPGALLAGGALAFVGMAMWTFAVLQVFLGATARTLAAELQLEPVRGSQAALAFVKKHWLGLILGSTIASAMVGLTMGALLSVVFGMARQSPLAGTLLIQPVFLFTLFGLALLWNCQLLPVVMGVENCSARTAVKCLLGKNPFWLASTMFEVVVLAIPKILATLPMVFIALALTVAATSGFTGESFTVERFSEPGLILSYEGILALWVGYASSVIATEFALQYYNKS